MSSKIVKVNEVLYSIKNSLREVPSRRELRKHIAVMDEQIALLKEVNTGLTTTMKGYKVSASSNYSLRPQSPQAGPSLSVHTHRQYYFGSDGLSFRDTESSSTLFGRIRGGTRSNAGAPEGAADRTSGGAAC